MREAWRWTHLADILARHPHLRSHLVAGLFWKADHGWLLLALAGLVLRRPALAAPYVWRRLRGTGRVRAPWCEVRRSSPGVLQSMLQN